MKRRIALLLGILLAVCFMFQAAAQEPEKKAAKTAFDRLSGRIQMFDKAGSTITLVRGNVRRTVVYSPETKITFRNKPSSMDEVREGRRVIVIGKFDAKARLAASRIDIRE